MPLLVLLIAAPASGDAWAQRTREKMRDARDQARRPTAEVPRVQRAPRAHSLAQQERDLLSDAVRRVERRTGGQVLSAEVVPYDGRDITRIKVVDAGGRVRVYLDDPVTGHGPRRIRNDDN